VSSAGQKFLDRFWGAVTANVVLLLSSGILAAIVLVFVFAFEYIKSAVETDSFVIESIDRQANATENYTSLLRSQRSVGNTTTVFFPAENYCNQNRQVPLEVSQGDIGGLLASPSRINGLYATVRFHRSVSNTSITFSISTGKILYIGTVGELPRNICFNQSENSFTIEYAGSELDVGANERILFVQTDEPGGRIVATGLINRTDAYLSAIFVVVLIFAGLLTVLFSIAVSNTILVRKNSIKDMEAREKNEKNHAETRENYVETRKEFLALQKDVQNMTRATTDGMNDVRRGMVNSANKDNRETVSDKKSAHDVTQSGISIEQVSDDDAFSLLKKSDDSYLPSSLDANSKLGKIFDYQGSVPSSKK